MSGSICVNVCVPFLFFLKSFPFAQIQLIFKHKHDVCKPADNHSLHTPTYIRSVVFKPPVITSVWCCILTHVNVVDPLLFQTAQSMGADADEGGVARTEIFRMAGMCGAPANHGEDAHKDSQNHHDLCLREEKL